jgi:dihydroorotate dehydrogenase electron transfer subunit
MIADGRCDSLFTCGSARLLEVVRRLAQGFGIPAMVALEQQMACGLGMCFCCVRSFRVDGQVLHRRVCYDGPVFDAREALE